MVFLLQETLEPKHRFGFKASFWLQVEVCTDENCFKLVLAFLSQTEKEQKS